MKKPAVKSEGSDEYDVGRYRRNREEFFASSPAKDQGITVLKNDRDIGNNGARNNLIPPEEVCAIHASER